MVNGTADCARNQRAASARQMFVVADGFGEGFEEVGMSLWEHVVKEIIVAVLDVFEELLPVLPHVIAIGMCTLYHCVFAGSCYSSAVSQEAVAGGREMIRKFSCSWLGTADERREIR